MHTHRVAIFKKKMNDETKMQILIFFNSEFFLALNKIYKVDRSETTTTTTTKTKTTKKT